MLNVEGWKINHKKVERVWRKEGLKVPQKQPKRSRLWLNDGSCIRLRPAYKNHVWSYDFVMARTVDGKTFKMLTIIDEYTRECLAIEVKRNIKAHEVIDVLFELFIFKGIPEHVRSDNGPEFTAKAIRKWLEKLGVKTLFIEPGSPWENGYIESFNGKLRDELLIGKSSRKLDHHRAGKYLKLTNLSSGLGRRASRVGTQSRIEGCGLWANDHPSTLAPAPQVQVYALTATQDDFPSKLRTQVTYVK